MSAPNPSTAQARVIADELVRCGVTDAVLAPGSRSTALALALHDREGLRLHVELDERSAGFLALGLARATGRPAPVVTTSGTAAVNLHPAVVEADAGRVPLLVLTADRPPEARDTGSNQTIDQIALFGGAVRWFAEVGVADDVPGVVAYWRATVDRAVATSRGLGGPAGPVHLNLPFREPTVPRTDDGRSSARPFEQSLDGRPDGRPWVAVERAQRRADPVLSERLGDRLARARRGLIVVGSTTVDPGAVHDLAAALGWPLVAEATSGVRGGPQAIRCGALLAADRGFADDHGPDLVLRIGRTGLSRPLASLLGPHVPQILVDADGAWDDPERTMSDLVAADPAPLCRDLAAGVAEPGPEGWLQEWRQADRAVSGAIDALLDAESTPTEPRTARDVAASVPDGGLLVVASSMPVRDLDTTMRPRTGLRLVANRGASGIDGFVSTALGVALAAGGPTTALSGDLSLLHDANGLLLSPDGPGVGLSLVVVDNDGGGIFHFLPQAGEPGFERLFGTPHGRDLGALAALHGLGYTQVADAAVLAPALDAAREAGGIHLVHVRTDRAANVEMHRGLREAAAEALRAGAAG